MSVFKHQQDDGDLSIITSDNSVLIACAEGHFWVLDAEMHEARRAVEGVEGLETQVAERQLNLLLPFGAPAFKALQLTEPRSD